MRSHHRFVPISTSELRISRISGEDNCTIVVVSDSSRREESTADVPPVHDLHPSQYAAAVYGGEWDIANVVEVRRCILRLHETQRSCKVILSAQ